MKKVLERLSKNKIYWILLIGLISIPASLPLLHGGFYHFSDEPHIANLYEMIRAISLGQFPPRMAPDMSWNFGYPLFNFYYPLPFYIGGLIFIFTQSLTISLKLVFLLTIPASGLMMFLWLKKHTDNITSLVGATIYIYTPYRAVDLYIRGAIGEALAFVFFPLVALAIDKLIDSPKNKNIGFLGIIVGLFILSHNLAPLIFIPFIFIYAVVRIINSGNKKILIDVLAGLILGFLISIFWSLPAFLEKNLLRTETPFNYLDHFPFIKQLIYSKWGYGASVWGPDDGISFQLGLINIFIIIYTFFIFIRGKVKKINKSLYYSYFGSLLVIIFLMNIRSKFLWELLPVANYIQFPWRLLMMTTFITASLVIFIKNKKLLLTLGVLAIAININYFKPSGYFNPNDDYYLKRFFANRSTNGETNNISGEYYNYSEDYLLLPKWVLRRPDSLPDAKIESDNTEIINVVSSNPFNYLANIIVKKDDLVKINNYYFPGWSVFLNDRSLPIKILEPFGNMGVEIPKGEWLIRIQWRETPFRKILDVVSLAGLLISLFLIFKKERKYEKD